MAVLLPLFAAAVLPTQIRTLVCRVTGAIMKLETCCPADDEAAPSTAQLLGENCCLVRTVDLPKLISEHRAGSVPPDLGQPVPLAQTFDAQVLADRRAQFSPPGPPSVGPPLLLLKRSFLI
jgi:hypothetical protein